MNKTGVLMVFLIGTRRYAYSRSFRRAKVLEWVITAMNAIGEASISFEDSTEEPTDPRTMLRGGSDPEDPIEAAENAVQDWEDVPNGYEDLEDGEVSC